ncbi:ABC transporter substrate-binding protein [Alcaligenaceae bacterium B3P038]|nr:ABC transporter substrate-binding protein [Alcaligenaceae bacterium B3P038]
MTLHRIALFTLAAALFAQAPLASARSLAEVQTAQTINVVTTAGGPPHGFLNPESNQLEGIMVDVSQALAKKLGVKLNLSSVPFAGLIPTLTSGRVDLMSAPLFITEERARVIDFSTPVYEWGEGLVAGTRSTKQIKNFDDLKGSKIGVLVDSVQFKMIKDMPDTKVSTYPDYVTVLSDVRAGRIELGIVDPPSVLYQIKSKNIPGVKMVEGYQPQRVWQVGLAVEKGNAELLAAVNKGIAEMKANGELAAIGQKWGVSELLSK